MTTSTISSAISGTISLGTGNYAPAVTVTATGSINAASIAVYGGLGVSHASLDNLGTINGLVELMAAGTIINFGNIGAAADSVNLRNGGKIINYGHIGAAGSAAIGVAMQNAVLTNYGTIGTAGNSIGVSVAFAYGTADTINNHSSIYGGQAGVVLSSISTLVNSGTIASAGFGIDEETSTSTVTNDGEIFGGTIGILSAGGMVVNNGTIAGSQAAISAYANALTLVAGAGAAFGGAVRDHTGHGVLELGSGSGNLDIGDFSGFATIDFGSGAQWVLQGTTTQLATGESVNGFTLGDKLVLDGFGVTSSSYSADTGLVLSSTGGNATLHAAGIGRTGVGLIESDTGTTIVTRAAAGYYFENIGTLEGRYLAVAGTAVNAGVMLGQSAGVTLGAGVSLVNRGSIGAYGTTVTRSGDLSTSRTYGGTGVLGTAAAYIDNTGTITGLETGISLADGGTIINAGTIAATGASTHYYGTVALAGGGYTYVSYREYGGGTAIINIKGALTLVDDPGAVFTGDVTDAAGNGVLTLASGSGTLDMSSFTGFSTIDFSTRSSWVLHGGLGQLATGEVINGFTAGDTIILDGFSAASYNDLLGDGIILTNGTGSVAVDATGLPGYVALNVTEANGDTTITAQTATISNYVSLAYGQSIMLGNGRYAANLTITGTGAIHGGLNYGPQITGNGTITNSGTIGGLSLGAATIINTGVINGYIGAIDLESGVIIDSGTIEGKAFLLQASGSVTVIVEPGAAFFGVDNSYLTDSSGQGTLVLGAGLGQFSLDPIFDGSSSGFNNISFAPGSMDLSASIDRLDGGVTLQGFSKGDTLQIGDFAVSTASYIAGTGIVLTGESFENSSIDTTIAINDGAPEGGFAFITQNGALEITAACFCRGTRIGTPHGGVAVERLAIGDVVLTDLGSAAVKWIGQRDYDGAFIAGNHLALPVRIRRHALGFNVPSRDVLLSPDHGVCEGGVFVPAWRLVNGVSITQAQSVERVEYFHIELEKPAVIFAENMPVESFVDADCRARFQNAAEFDLLYPGPATPQRHARPRVEEGFLLARIKQRIDARARVVPRSSAGPLRGCIDETGPRLRGWAQDATAPETPVLLEILHDGMVIGTILANRYRPDLRKAGLGSGCHAFELPMPLPGIITLRRAGDGAIITAPPGAIDIRDSRMA